MEGGLRAFITTVSSDGIISRKGWTNQRNKRNGVTEQQRTGLFFKTRQRISRRGTMKLHNSFTRQTLLRVALFRSFRPKKQLSDRRFCIRAALESAVFPVPDPVGKERHKRGTYRLGGAASKVCNCRRKIL